MEINNLTLNEEKLRNLYLRKIALGEIYGPITGKPSEDKIWLSKYSEESIVEDLSNSSIAQSMRNAASKYGKKISSSFAKVRRTFEDDIKKGDLIANALVSCGVKPGEKVLVSVPCIPEYRYLFYAINKVGAVSVWLDFRTGEDELTEVIGNIDNCKISFTFGGVCERVENAIAKNGNKIEKCIEINTSETIPEMFISKILEFKELRKNKSLIEDRKFSLKKFLNLYDDVNVKKCYKFEPNSTAAIVFTGGTTGKGKGVELTNENFNALVNGYKNTDLDFVQGDDFLQFLPPWTAYGLAIDYVCFLMGLNSKYIPKLDPSTYDKLIIKERPQHTTGIPKNLDILLNSKSIKDNTDLSFFKTAAVGADTMNVSKEKEVNDFFQKHNSSTRVIKGYGMTEGCATVCTTTNKTNKLGSVGIPFVNNIIKIVDPETNEELPYGKIGEICYCGPSLMKKYYKNDYETDRVIETDENGRRWMHSGDLGYIDQEGFLFISGRIKKMFVRSGFKIFTPEIDDIISQHPDVENVVAVGIKDEIEGSIPVVNIMLKKDCLKSQKEIIDEFNSMCKEKLYDYYFPLQYRFIDEIPYTKNGKVDFVKLTQQTEIELNSQQKTLRLR